MFKVLVTLIAIIVLIFDRILWNALNHSAFIWIGVICVLSMIAPWIWKRKWIRRIIKAIVGFLFLGIIFNLFVGTSGHFFSWTFLYLVIILNFFAIRRAGFAFEKTQTKAFWGVALSLYILFILPAFQALTLWILGFLDDFGIHLFQDSGNFYVSPVGMMGHVALIITSLVLSYTLIRAVPELKRLNSERKWRF